MKPVTETITREVLLEKAPVVLKVYDILDPYYFYFYKARRGKRKDIEHDTFFSEETIEKFIREGFYVVAVPGIQDYFILKSEANIVKT